MAGRETLQADPTTLRAIAHPVRNRILHELHATGPMRAADVADVLGVPANQASFHLRQLAKYGLVVEAPEAARDGRDRVWKPAQDQVSINPTELEKTPGGKAAVQVFHGLARTRAHEVVDLVFSHRKTKGEFSSQSESALRLTAEEAAELAEEVRAVVARWGEQTARPGRRGGAADLPLHGHAAALPGLTQDCERMVRCPVC